MKTKKKLMTLTAGLLLSITASAQYSITASQVKLPDGMVVYLRQEGQITDSATVQGGSFVIKNDKKIYPTYCIIVSKDNTWGGQFWLGNDQVTIDGPSGKISGAPEEDAFQAYREALKPAWDKAEQAMKERDADFQRNGSKNWDAYGKKIKKYTEDEADSLFVIFCDAHPRAYICLNHIYNHRVLDKYPFKRYAALAKHLDWSAFGGKQWETFMELYNMDKSLEPGNVFRGKYVGEDPYGVKDSIAAYRGKYVLVAYGNAGLPGYSDNTADRIALYNKLKGKNYTELDILLTKNANETVKACSDMVRPWNVISDYKEFWSKSLTDIGIDKVPVFFFLDPQGKILAHTFDYAEAKKVIEQTLAR
jgi:hypothetical protein